MNALAGKTKLIYLQGGISHDLIYNRVRACAETPLPSGTMQAGGFPERLVE